MTITERDVTQAAHDLKGRFGGVTNDYFGLLYLEKEFCLSREEACEQIAYGGDPEEFVQFGINAVRAPGDEKHPIYLVRIPAGEGCAYVLANQCTLFGGK